uniref:Reverse transcriptase zinc-binding domain-containing protein n=1 Tax=Cannabis sativa TaxID=3483 RepID=A0A803P1L1_CANSA
MDYTQQDIDSAGVRETFRVFKLYNSSFNQFIDPAAKAIWCSLNVPKHGFILWQAVHSNLLTRDMLSRFQIVVENTCCAVCGTVGWVSMVGILPLAAGAAGYLLSSRAS